MYLDEGNTEGMKGGEKKRKAEKKSQLKLISEKISFPILEFSFSSFTQWVSIDPSVSPKIPESKSSSMSYPLFICFLVK